MTQGRRFAVLSRNRVAAVLGFFLATFLSLLLPGAARAQADWESAPRFVEADQAYMERADPARAAFANERYEALYRADPEDWEAAWRLAMTSYYLGSRVASEKPEKEALFLRGQDVAEASALLKPDCAPCHLLAGINMALYGQSVGVVKMIFTLRAIRGHLNRSLELDPTFAEGAAARTLATIDQVVPFFLGGSKKRAQKYYAQALEIDPSDPLNYLFYARFFAGRHEYKAALDLTERGLALPRPGPERVESRDGWDRLQALLPKLREAIAEQPKPFRRLKPGQRKRR